MIKFQKELSWKSKGCKVKEEMWLFLLHWKKKSETT